MQRHIVTSFKMADISRNMLHDALNAFLELKIQKAVDV